MVGKSHPKARLCILNELAWDPSLVGETGPRTWGPEEGAQTPILLYLHCWLLREGTELWLREGVRGGNWRRRVPAIERVAGVSTCSRAFWELEGLGAVLRLEEEDSVITEVVP